MADAFFRANVGACVLNDQGRVLALRRIGVRESAWQMPQGGIERTETPAAAVLRELAEETGLPPEAVQVLAEHPGWLVYEVPVAWRNDKVGWGQAQKWFVLRARGDAVVRPDGVEFDAHDWFTPEQLLAHCAAFRRPTYERVLAFVAELSG